MDYILKKYCPRIEFDNYEQMKREFTINVPDHFNFGYDVVDEWARVEPQKLALRWTNDLCDPGNWQGRRGHADFKAAARGMVFHRWAV